MAFYKAIDLLQKPDDANVRRTPFKVQRPEGLACRILPVDHNLRDDAEAGCFPKCAATLRTSVLLSKGCRSLPLKGEGERSKY